MPTKGRTLEGEKVRARSEYSTRHQSQPLADLLDEAAELERKLNDMRSTIQFELTQPAHDQETAPGQGDAAADDGQPDAMSHPQDADQTQVTATDAAPPADDGEANPDDGEDSPPGRTDALVNQGRSSSYRPGLSRGPKVAIAAAIIAALVTTAVIMMTRGGASWPASVAIVQSETAKACENPDVVSEPGQINFACTKASRQILWVFALMASADDPNFSDGKTGRVGLEPITPTQGGQVAWSLNLHHPYNPFNPIDSLEVAARAINNIIGGATVTGDRGNPVIQPGLESSPANCGRYSGSTAITSRQGFPSLCAKPVTSRAGQAALVADIYRKWFVAAAANEAQDAAVLFANAKDPGNPQVQAVLAHLQEARLPA